MEYACKSIPINKLPIDFNGVIMPLCVSCQSADCTNNLEYRKISVLGINKKYRVLVRDTDVGIVIECQGYIV
jgi:hypothetical protein